MSISSIILPYCDFDGYHSMSGGAYIT